MAAELRGPDPARFFYHLGDVVYPHGEEANYRPQFFSAYADYGAPIFAVPGNHDGESTPSSLQSFVRTFCSDAPPLHDAAEELPRPLSRQPHVYWTLTHEWVWIIGLYANVPEGGQFEEEQLRWLVGELRAAPADATLILALHQPVYGADLAHGANLTLGDVLDDCFAAGRPGAGRRVLRTRPQLPAVHARARRPADPVHRGRRRRLSREPRARRRAARCRPPSPESTASRWRPTRTAPTAS